MCPRTHFITSRKTVCLPWPPTSSLIWPPTTHTLAVCACLLCIVQGSAERVVHGLYGMQRGSQISVLCHCHRSHAFATLCMTGGGAVRALVNIQLDVSQCVLLSNDQLLVSLKTGQLYLLTLTFDGRAVVRMDLDASNASVLPSCVRSPLTPCHNQSPIIKRPAVLMTVVVWNAGDVAMHASQSISVSGQPVG